MSNQPIRQHFIPKSYLKNFAIYGGKSSYLVDAYRLDEELMLRKISTKNICLQKNLYTLKTKEEEKKYFLELYYANNVDSEYSKVYKLLIDENIIEITTEQKYKILYVCLSLYFRTPKFLNHQNKFIDQIFDKIKYTADKNRLVKVDYFDEKLEFNLSEIEKVKASYKEKNKIQFQVKHFERWYEFTKFNYKCNLIVTKIPDCQAPLITSDNPVSIREAKSSRFKGLFNPNNIITLPLDENHFLQIYPDQFSSEKGIINRLTQDKDFVLMTNALTEQNAENWLIGKPNTIDIHFLIQEKYKTVENQENLISNLQFKTEEMHELLILAEKEGIDSKLVIQKIKRLYYHPKFKGDEQLKNYKKWLEEIGKW